MSLIDKKTDFLYGNKQGEDQSEYLIRLISTFINEFTFWKVW